MRKLGIFGASQTNTASRFIRVAQGILLIEDTWHKKCNAGVTFEFEPKIYNVWNEAR